MKKMFLKTVLIIVTTMFVTSTMNAQDNTIVTLYGYLKVFPEDLGEFSSVPTNTIAIINKDGTHGYNNWRNRV